MVVYAAPNKIQLTKTNVEVQSHSGELLKPTVETRGIPPTTASVCTQHTFRAKCKYSSASEDHRVKQRCTFTVTCLCRVCSVRSVGLFSIDAMPEIVVVPYSNIG